MNVWRGMIDSDIIDTINSQLVFLFRWIDVVELNIVIDAFFSEGDSLVDLDRLRKLSIRLQVSGFVGGIFQNDVSTSILKSNSIACNKAYTWEIFLPDNPWGQREWCRTGWSRPFCEAYHGCGKDAWRHRSTWLRRVHCPAFWWLGHTPGRLRGTPIHAWGLRFRSYRDGGSFLPFPYFWAYCFTFLIRSTKQRNSSPGTKKW